MSAAPDPLRRPLEAEPPAWLDALVSERASVLLAEGARRSGSGAARRAWRRLQQLAAALGARAAAAAAPRELGRAPGPTTLSDSTS